MAGLSPIPDKMGGMAAWETLVAGIAGGLVGVGGTYLGAWRTGRTQMAVARQQERAQVAIAREERQQRRFEEAYTEMLEVVTRIRYWVFTVYPMLTRTQEEYTMPPVPELPDIAKSEALWTVYWSPRVEQLMEEWEQIVRKLQITGSVIGVGRALEAKGQASQIDLTAKLMELDDLKGAVLDADKRLRKQVRAELLGRDDGHAIDVPSALQVPGLMDEQRDQGDHK
jgi:hypothetical protein